FSNPAVEPHDCGNSPVESHPASPTALTKPLMSSADFFPGAVSTPLAVSTPYGRKNRTASAALSGFSPPATTRPGTLRKSAASVQSNVFPEPGAGASSRKPSAGQRRNTAGVRPGANATAFSTRNDSRT